jgi:L-threonylcarbamoyladenylate synthase
MNTAIVRADSPDAIQRALVVLNKGGLIAFPTDTVYGVGAPVFDGKAVESIYVAKDRPIEKAIPVLIADADDMDKVGMDIPDVARGIAARFFPGPLTCLIPKQPTLPSAVSATSTVGVRVPDHEVARALPPRGGTDGSDIGKYFWATESVHCGGSVRATQRSNRIDH